MKRCPASVRARSSWRSPNRLISTHIGTSTSSNATKKSTASRAVKVASAPASTMSRQPRKVAGVPPSGTSTHACAVTSTPISAVRSTRGTAMPSTPNDQRTPSSGSQARSTSGRATVTATREHRGDGGGRGRHDPGAGDVERATAGDEPETDDGGDEEEQAHDHASTPATPSTTTAASTRPTAELGRSPRKARVPAQPAARVATAVPRT